MAIRAREGRDMKANGTSESTDSPVAGVIPAPTRVHDDAVAADELNGSRSARDPDAEREARRTARDELRAAPAERPGAMPPTRGKRAPLEAPLRAVLATGGIVATAVVIAAVMGSQDAAGWLIGAVASIVSLVLAAWLRSSGRV